MTKQSYRPFMKKLLVIGKPLAHSKSPLMHNAALKELGLEKEYNYSSLELEQAELESLCNKIKAGEITGANITIPYKTLIIPYLDSLTKEAEFIGAVNTIYVSEGMLMGDNTDARGFGLTLQENNIITKDKSALILGYGGSAKAVVSSLISLGIKNIDFSGRNDKKAKDFIDKIKTNTVLNYLSTSELKDNRYSLIINCTPLGMAGENKNKIPLDISFLRKDNIVVDLVYNPRDTLFLIGAKTKGCKILNGLEMLVNQGALSLEIWTGKKPNRELMKQVILD